MERIIYSKNIDDISSAALEGFFVGWKIRPSIETHLALLKHSNFVVTARAGTKVVGFVTAVSDGVLSAYIPFLEVLPAYQNQGIGKELVALMLEELKDFYMVDLQCDQGLQSFYETLSMNKSVGMSIRRYDRQAGM